MSLRLSELLRDGCILGELEAPGRRALLGQVLARLSEGGWIADTEAVRSALMEREALCATALGNDCAIPHTFIGGVRDLLIATAWLPRGVDFKGLDGQPVHLVFLILGPPEAQGRHLEILSKLSRLLADAAFRDRLIEARGEPAKVLAAFREREA